MLQPITTGVEFQSLQPYQSAEQKGARRITIKNISDLSVLNIITYLIPQEAVHLLLTCRQFNHLNSERLWKTLCKLQSPLIWDHDPFYHQIAQIKKQTQRRLAYNQLCGLRAKKLKEPWKIKTKIDLQLQYSSFTTFLKNGTIVTKLGNSIHLWSRAAEHITTISHHMDSSIFSIPGGFVTKTRYDHPNSHQVYIWSDTGERIAILEHDAPVGRVGVYPNGEILTESSNILYRWTPDGKLVTVYAEIQSIERNDIRILEDGTFATQSNNGPLRIWSRGGLQIATFYHYGCTGMAALQDGKVITISGESIWLNHSYVKQAVIWSSDGTSLLTFGHPCASSFLRMHVKVLQNGNIVTAGTGELKFFLWSPEGKFIAERYIGGIDGLIDSIFTLSNGYGFVILCSCSVASIWSMAGHLITKISNVKQLWEISNGEIATINTKDKMIYIWSVDVQGLSRAHMSFFTRVFTDFSSCCLGRLRNSATDFS